MVEAVNKKYPHRDDRKGVWLEIVRFVEKDAGQVRTLLELGSGYCDFINQFEAEKKVCFEQNEEMRRFADDNVEFRCGDALSLINKEEKRFDLIFASNFLEHLTEKQHSELMPRLYEVLEPDGRLILIQPNYNRCREHYFDDETHQTIFSDSNIGSFLKQYNFETIRLLPGLLPFTMECNLPTWSWLVKMYLASPVKPFAAQMYVVASK